MFGTNERLIGLVEGGDPTCTGDSMVTRVDVHRDAFLRPLIRNVEGGDQSSTGCAVARTYRDQSSPWLAIATAAAILFVRRFHRVGIVPMTGSRRACTGASRRARSLCASPDRKPSPSDRSVRYAPYRR